MKRDYPPMPVPVDAYEQLRQTPNIPDGFYEDLPKLLKDACGSMPDKRSRDVVLLSSLTVLGGMIPNVFGIYDGRKVGTNLYLLVVAPPASGKGMMHWARQLGQARHLDLIEQSRPPESAYKRRKPGEFDKLVDKSLFIPADASSAAFIRALQENDESGIMFEAEADNVLVAFKQDWGNYSTILRQAFHHEPVGNLRSAGTIWLERPTLSVAMSGTLNQAMGLLQSTENGLFSRFMYYPFSIDHEWRDVGPGNDGHRNLDELFSQLGLKAKRMAEKTVDLDTIEVRLTPDQWKDLNRHCTERLEYITQVISSDLNSNVYRHGLIMFRIAMILTIVRHYEADTLAKELECTAYDFHFALNLGELLLKYAVAVYRLLPANSTRANHKQVLFLNQLPSEFTKAEAEEAGERIGIKSRSVTGYLQTLLQSGELAKQEHGRYKKKAKAQ